MHSKANDIFELETAKYALDTDSTFSKDQGLSTIRTTIQLSDDWINHFLSAQKIVVPLSKKHHLTDMRFQWMPERMKFIGEISEKPGSWIDLQCRPVWHSQKQSLEIQEVKLQIRSKNILVKGAGWFSRTFMQSKIDRKSETAVNQLYHQAISKLYEQPLSISVLQGGRLAGQVTSMRIHEMQFTDRHLNVNLTVEGRLHLQFV